MPAMLGPPFSRGEAGTYSVVGMGAEWRDRGSCWHGGLPGRAPGTGWALRSCQCSGEDESLALHASPFLTSVLLLWRGQEPRCPCVGQECAPCSPIWLSADLYSTLLPLQTGFLKPLITKLSFSLKQLYLAEGTVVTQLEGTHPTRKVTRP